MKTATATLRGIGRYSQSAVIMSPKNNKETSCDHEERCWMERAHIGPSGNMMIPAQSFKNCLSTAAKYIGEQIPGKGKATYTKYFEAGVLVIEDVDTGVHKSAIVMDRRFVPADGKRGGPKRVWKNFPAIDAWIAITNHRQYYFITIQMYNKP